ncbi:MAG: tRNA (adenine(22)-N(1))-methyltransferase [Candidatus Aphodocola sp.]|mgnify:FL=1
MTNIKLSKRLSVIASLVPENAVIADIGCDHALLDIYLSKKKIIKKSFAIDITKGALNQADKNIKLYNAKNIETRLSDGFEKIDIKDNVDTVIMSGLGDAKIINILKEAEEKLNKVNNIIIQSNVGVSNIRVYLTCNGYYIDNEKLVKENNIIYTVISFKKGYKSYTKKEIEFGPVLLRNKDELFNELIINRINKNNYIINKLPKNKLIKKMFLKINNHKLKKEMIQM